MRLKRLVVMSIVIGAAIAATLIDNKYLLVLPILMSFVIAANSYIGLAEEPDMRYGEVLSNTSRQHLRKFRVLATAALLGSAYSLLSTYGSFKQEERITLFALVTIVISACLWTLSIEYRKKIAKS